MTESSNYSVAHATHPTYTIALPCGISVNLHRLRNPEQDECIASFAALAEQLATLLEHPPTREEVKEFMPEVFRGMAHPFLPPALFGDDEEMRGQLARSSQTAVVSFLNIFMDEPLTCEHITAWEVDDFTAIWEALWQLCRIPFEAGYTLAKNLGSLDKASGQGEALRKEIASLTATISAQSSAPDSTPEIPPSKSNTVRRSTRRKPAMNTSKPSASGTGQVSAVPPNTATADSKNLSG